METSKLKKTKLSDEKKLLKTVQSLFILISVQLKMKNEDIRAILGIDKDAVNRITKLVPRFTKENNGKDTK